MLVRVFAQRASRCVSVSSTARTMRLTHFNPMRSIIPLRTYASHVPDHLSFHTSATSFNKSPADAIVEELTELYGTAQDEFEMAMEETEKITVYAEDDRAAAREELEKLKEAYQKVMDGDDEAVAEEVSRRVGQRIRELEQGVNRMEEIAMEQD